MYMSCVLSRYDRMYCPCALSGTGPSTGHHELLARFLFNCYQTSYTAYSTLYLYTHKLFLTKSALCSEIKKRLFVTLCHACPLMSSRGSWCVSAKDYIRTPHRKWQVPYSLDFPCAFP